VVKLVAGPVYRPIPAHTRNRLQQSVHKVSGFTFTVTGLLSYIDNSISLLHDDDNGLTSPKCRQWLQCLSDFRQRVQRAATELLPTANPNSTDKTHTHVDNHLVIRFQVIKIFWTISQAAFAHGNPFMLSIILNGNMSNVWDLVLSWTLHLWLFWG
jgi:hypothetical protein